MEKVTRCTAGRLIETTTLCRDTRGTSDWNFKTLQRVIQVSQVNIVDDVVTVSDALTNICKSFVPPKTGKRRIL